MTEQVAINKLFAHPKNPRLVPRDDVVTSIASQLETSGEFDEAHGLIVRPNGKGYEIISGHHRWLAAKQAKLKEVPCFVREMSDDDAYMALVLYNAHGELSDLEKGMHALNSGLTQQDYADRLAMPRETLKHRWQAATVAQAIDIVKANIGLNDIKDLWLHLAEIHPAQNYLWPGLVRMVLDDKKRTVAGTVSEVTRFRDTTKATLDTFAQEEIAEEITERFTNDLVKRLSEEQPTRFSDLNKTCEEVEKEFIKLTSKGKRVTRRMRLRGYTSLTEWGTLSKEDQQELLNLSLDSLEPGENPGNFNEQENEAIGWAQYSWNPITGCEHNCPYCYARDKANSKRFAKIYPHGFEPTLCPRRLLAPQVMKVSKKADADTSFRNVFTGSMSDLFGRWVPKEWIEAVLRRMREAPQWNFLCLTKFPKRFAEFDIPDNAWMGTTVDMQARVNNAEAAFQRLKDSGHNGIRWLSVEPMLTPLKFKKLELFNWIVIGGASRSDNTPEWRPPFEWYADLVLQAREAGVRPYFKTNLFYLVQEMPFGAPMPSVYPRELPEQFKYLGNQRGAE